LALCNGGLVLESTTSVAWSLLHATGGARIFLIVFGSRTIRRTGSDDAEQHEPARCCGAENQRGIAAHKIGRSLEEPFDRLTPHGLRKLIDLLRYSPHEPRQLRSVLVETVRSHPYRLRNVTNKIGSSRNLVIQEPLGLFSGL